MVVTCLVVKCLLGHGHFSYKVKYMNTSGLIEAIECVFIGIFYFGVGRFEKILRIITASFYLLPFLT